uniref:EamA domain-containing protein n=1 Tax=Phaeomonas parva TaxID=124430 RepID=A0A7S1XWH7_9STRA|mmetsp:Transcript_40104/g.125568  ORF Transcript_40104/g.125568 Transcript_40104/m.125568 type:complete len:555 (+) Transcript_40104:203-1867(+)
MESERTALLRERRGRQAPRAAQPSPVRNVRALKELETKVTKQQSYVLALYVTLSVVFCAANQIYYKKLLNRFSSGDGKHNFEFFVSQWSTVLYLGQALPILLHSLLRDFIARRRLSDDGDEMKPKSTWAQLVATPATHWGFFVMGVLDAACSTLGALGGAGTPGQLQTLINQSVIPITIFISWAQQGKRFKKHQMVGAGLIVLGCVTGALSLFGPGAAEDDDGGAARAVSWTAIALFSVSVVPGAYSNVYKESYMKEDDLDVYVTTTVVSFWQELLGFLFLPLMLLRVFGGLQVSEIKEQMSGGFECFMGYDPHPNPGYNCAGAGYLFWFYVVINFTYNIILLLITKHGSAVLLVISNALALPVTNVAFTIPFFMGDDTERFTAADLAGLILVVVGFLTYSAFGLAKKFMVAQGPPGQMTYTPIDQQFDLDVATVDPRSASARALTSPNRLARFLATIVSPFVDGDDLEKLPLRRAGEEPDQVTLRREVELMLFARDLAARAISVLDEQITRLETFYAQKYPDANEMPKQRSSYGNLAAAVRLMRLSLSLRAEA